MRRATGAVRGRGAAAQLLGPRSGYRMLAGPRGRRAAAGVSPGNTAGLVRALAPPSRACGVDPQSFRSLPRARTRCGSAWFCAAPPISGEQPLGALAAERRERATDRRAWPVVREDTPGRVECHVRGVLRVFFGDLRPQPNVLAEAETSKNRRAPRRTRGRVVSRLETVPGCRSSSRGSQGRKKWRHPQPRRAAPKLPSRGVDAI